MLTGNVWVGCRLKRTQSVTNDEDGGAEASKGTIQHARPGDQSSNGVETQPPDEDGLVSIVSKDPIGVAERCQWVCSSWQVSNPNCRAEQSRQEQRKRRHFLPKVSRLKTCRTSSGDAQRSLEMLVEGIDEAIGEAPEEEQHGDEADGPDGSPQRQVSSFGALVIARLQRTLEDHGEQRNQAWERQAEKMGKVERIKWRRCRDGILYLYLHERKKSFGPFLSLEAMPEQTHAHSQDCISPVLLCDPAAVSRLAAPDSGLWGLGIGRFLGLIGSKGFPGP